MQTKLQSAVEVLASTAIGYGVALLAQLFILEYYKIELPMSDNLKIVAFFTVVSIIRGYGVRRLFNYVNGRKHEAKK